MDNKPGAGGNIGLDAVAKSAPDGYTFGMGQTANLAINPALLPSMPFNPRTDLIPVALVAAQPTVLVVPQDSPWKSVQDLVKAAKADPGGIRQGLASTGTVGHLAGEMLAFKAGIQVLNVPYKGAAPAVTDLLGKQTHYMFGTPQAVYPLLKGGKLRALAVTSAKRLPILPEVPPVAESGYAGFEAVDWKAHRRAQGHAGCHRAEDEHRRERGPAAARRAAATAGRGQHGPGRQHPGRGPIPAQGTDGLGRADPRRKDTPGVTTE